MMTLILQGAQEVLCSLEIAVDNQSIDLRLGKLGKSPLRFRFHIYINMQAAEDAFQHTDFLPVARNHHGRESHACTLIPSVISPQITKGPLLPASLIRGEYLRTAT